MIKITEGEFADLLPNYLKDQESIMAISYAYKMAVADLISMSETSRTYSDIDSMPEFVLDYMAVELDAQYYTEDMNLNEKRNVIKKSLVWKMKAGTKMAVQELISTIFGDGSVTEWNDFPEGAGTPGTFDITTSAVSTKDMVEKFSRLLRKTKNATSHLRYVTTEHEIGTTLSVLRGNAQDAIQTITDDVHIDNPDQAYINDIYIAPYDFAEVMDELVVANDSETAIIPACFYTAAFTMADSITIINEKH